MRKIEPKTVRELLTEFGIGLKPKTRSSWEGGKWKEEPIGDMQIPNCGILARDERIICHIYDNRLLKYYIAGASCVFFCYTARKKLTAFKLEKAKINCYSSRCIEQVTPSRALEFIETMKLCEFEPSEYSEQEVDAVLLAEKML